MIILNYRILDLQKERFFENLQAKYWNHSNQGDCDQSDDNEGITLESLGGVFIATLFGLALAMITLAAEVFYYKRKQKQEAMTAVVDLKKEKGAGDVVKYNQPPTVSGGSILLGGETFKPNKNQEGRMSHLALYSRPRNRLPVIE